MAEPRIRDAQDDTSPEARRALHRMYQSMSPEDKLKLVFRTYDTGRELAMAGIRMRRPDADEAEVRQLWVQQHLGPELFDAAYGAMSCE